MPFEQFLSPDGLHMNDWSYACIAKLLAAAILDGAKPPDREPRPVPARLRSAAAAERRRSHLIQRGEQVLAQIVRVLEPA